jgi:ribosomal protein S27AE
MLQFEYTSIKPTIYDRPKCPKCTRQMFLAHIEPGKPGFDLRTFACPRCEHSESILVKNVKADGKDG